MGALATPGSVTIGGSRSLLFVPTGTPTGQTQLAAVEIFSATDNGLGKVTVTWTNPVLRPVGIQARFYRDEVVFEEKLFTAGETTYTSGGGPGEYQVVMVNLGNGGTYIDSPTEIEDETVTSELVMVPPPAAPEIQSFDQLEGTSALRVSYAAVPTAYGYEYRIDEGDWVDVGNDLAFDVLLAPAEEHEVEVRAYNLAGRGPIEDFEFYARILAPVVVLQQAFDGFDVSVTISDPTANADEFHFTINDGDDSGPVATGEYAESHLSSDVGTAYNYEVWGIDVNDEDSLVAEATIVLAGRQMGQAVIDTVTGSNVELVVTLSVGTVGAGVQVVVRDVNGTERTAFAEFDGMTNYVATFTGLAAGPGKITVTNLGDGAGLLDSSPYVLSLNIPDA